MSPTMSVIITTYNRPRLLGDCLDTLVAQDAPPGSVEIIVVDDGSTLDVKEPVEAVQGAPIPVRLVSQPNSGQSAARNTGASEARGSLLAYVDDDVLVSKGWAQAVLSLFDETGCDAMAGKIELKLEGPRPRWLDNPNFRKYLCELDLGDERRELRAPELPVGANSAVTKESFERVGGFDTGLGLVGSSMRYNDDFAFFSKVRSQGDRIMYEPSAHVLHRIAPERLTEEWFCKRNYAQGLSDVLQHAPQGKGAMVTASLRDLLRTGRVAPIVVRNLAFGRGLASARFWLSYSKGRRDALRELRGPS